VLDEPVDHRRGADVIARDRIPGEKALLEVTVIEAGW
jgi:hypothetical protein